MKNLIKKLLREGLLRESKATEAQALNIRKKMGDESPEETINDLKGIDNSKNQTSLPAMAMLFGPNVNGNDLKSVFAEYDELVSKKRVKPAQATKKGVVLGDNVFGDFLKFSEYIHGETNKYSVKTKGSSADADFVAEDKPIWSGNNIDIYDGVDVGKCIKYTQGSLTGKGYGFCIGQPGNTMYQSYRDSKTSSFYFIIDRNKFVTEDNGSVNLDDPLHIVVFDNTKHGVELTDANNSTGNIAEFGSDTDGYITYLESKGVPVDDMEHKEKTPEEEEEQKLLGNSNSNLEWFIKLPYEYKSKYIGRGHQLTDEQFDYLIGG